MDRKQIQEAHEKYAPEYDEHYKKMKIETQCIHTGQDPDIWGNKCTNICLKYFRISKSWRAYGKMVLLKIK